MQGLQVKVGYMHRLSFTSSFSIENVAFVHVSSAEEGRCIYANGDFYASIHASYFAHIYDTGSPCGSAVQVLCPDAHLRRSCFVDCIGECGASFCLVGDGVSSTTVRSVSVHGCDILHLPESQNLVVILDSKVAITGYNASDNYGHKHGMGIRLTPAAGSTMQYSILTDISGDHPVNCQAIMTISNTNFVTLRYTLTLMTLKGSTLSFCVFRDIKANNVNKLVFDSVILQDCVFDGGSLSGAVQTVRCSFYIANPTLQPHSGARPECTQPTYMPQTKFTAQPLLFPALVIAG